MSIDLKLIKNIIVVMMENRSFDHALGYLSLPPYNRKDVEGLKNSPDWLNAVSNPHNGVNYPPFLLKDPYHNIDADPLHERSNIAVQMGTASASGFPLKGFVGNYVTSGGKCLSKDNPPPVMGYYAANQVPIADFFAKNFTICDQWFAPLPAGTQPNRLMAMSGETHIDVNHRIIPNQKLVYDWLTENSIPWRVYHEGMPFFALMEEWIPDILLDKNFRSFERFQDDIDNRDDEGANFPQVIFLEPTYTDAPHIGPSSDDHAPTAIKGGQQFLSTVYRIITSDPDFWNGSVMIVTYDEHGGFFDHVSPPAIGTNPPTGINYPSFQSLGVRVPAFIISPFVDGGTVCHDVMDHTSILKFIGKKFKGGAYSPTVDQRKVGNVYDILKAPKEPPGNAPPMLSLDDYLNTAIPKSGYTPDREPQSGMQEGFQNSLETIRQNHPNQGGKFEDLLKSFPPSPKTVQS